MNIGQAGVEVIKIKIKLLILLFNIAPEVDNVWGQVSLARIHISASVCAYG
jgi:hypothetical protein